MKKVPSIHPQDSLKIRNETDRFFELLNQYADFATRAGKKVRRSEPDMGQRLFLSLEPSVRSQLIARLEDEVSIFESMIQEGESPENASRHLWRYFSKSKQIPCSDVFDKILITDLLQVFSLENTLLFVNLNFLDYVSFTLEQIFCTPWHLATRRDPKHEAILFTAVKRIVSGEVQGTIDPENEWHWVEEIGTEMLFSYRLRVRWVSPVFSKQNLTSFLGIVECSKDK